MPSQRLAFSNIEKRALRAYYAQHRNLTQQQLRTWFKASFAKPITQGTVSQILSSQYTYLDTAILVPEIRSRKWQKQQQYPALERALSDWCVQRQAKPPITGDVIREQASFFWHHLELHRPAQHPSHLEVGGWNGQQSPPS
jgi:hypothetical protein